MVADQTYAALAALSVTASLPFYLYGAWYVIETETVTWPVLVHHLRIIAVGLVLTTVPVVTWMGPRLLEQFGGLSALHAVVGLQAYALLVFALTGIVRIFQVKRRHDLYHDPDPDVAVNDLHENMPAWRRRLRVGVAGYVVLWLVAWLLGLVQFVEIYL